MTPSPIPPIPELEEINSVMSSGMRKRKRGRNMRASSTRPMSRGGAGLTPYMQRQSQVVIKKNFSSRFNEVQVLKKEVERLRHDNNYIRKQFLKIDEYRLAMEKESDLKNFNEKRINLLKSHIAR